MSAPSRIVTADDIVAESFTSGGAGTKSTTTMISVEAPSNLPGGYVFDVVHTDGRVVSVTVPDGGVKTGQVFDVSIPADDEEEKYSKLETTKNKNNNSNDDPLIVVTTTASQDQPATEVIATEVTPIIRTTTTTTTTSNFGPGGSTDTDPAPYGIWKDGLCDCCILGCCHPSLCCAIFCPQLLMGQVLTRMHMTWCGMSQQSQHDQNYKSTFPTLLLLTMIYLFVSYWIGENGRHHPLWGLVRLVYFIYMLVIMSKLRKAVRTRYKIPERDCVGCEDCCCVFWCSCCTVSQLARQTVSYDQRRAVPCSSTGLPDNATHTLVVDDNTNQSLSSSPPQLPEQTATLLV